MSDKDKYRKNRNINYDENNDELFDDLYDENSYNENSYKDTDRRYEETEDLDYDEDDDFVYGEEETGHYRSNYDDRYSDQGIRINRKQRKWNRYGKYILAACIAAAAIIALIAIASAIGSRGVDDTSSIAGQQESALAGSSNEQSQIQTQSTNETESVEGTKETSEDTSKETSQGKDETDKKDDKSDDSAKDDKSETAESGATTTSDANKADTSEIKFTGSPKAVEMSSEDFYENSLFVGDTFVCQIDEYGCLSTDRLYSSGFFPVTYANMYVDDIADEKPDRIFVQFGFDDANLGDEHTAKRMSEDIEDLIATLQEKLPDTEFYCLSEMPITEEYNDESSDAVTQATLDKLNELLKKDAKKKGYTFIDVAEVFKNGGYLDGKYSSDGYHITDSYYPYVLNGIAKMLQEDKAV